MERSRSKRFYNTNEDETRRRRTKQRYSLHSLSENRFIHGKDYGYEQFNRRSGDRKVGGQDFKVTTRFKILCHDARAGGVIGRGGGIIKSIREHTGARVCVHDLVTGDDEHVIEISDTRMSFPEERMPEFSPAQEALILVHDRILDSYDSYGGLKDEEGGGNSKNNHHHNRRGGGGGGGVGLKRVVTRLVVPEVLVGSLMGRGGKIIKQMRLTSKAYIKVLTSEQTLPRCVADTEEVVQVTGGVDSVRDALERISWRLRQCQHREQIQSWGRHHSLERFPPYDDDFIPQRSNRRGTPSVDMDRSNTYQSRSSGHVTEFSNGPVIENGECVSGVELVFRILCPVEKLNAVIGESDGIIKLLQDDIGVDVRVADQTDGSDEQIIIITSDEGPDDVLFPAQEALLHIQTRIFGLDSAKEKTFTTRLLLKSDEIEYLGGRDGVLLLTKNITGATVQVLPTEERPACAPESDEILQIVGEIKAAREVLIEVTSRLRSCIYGELSQEETTQFLPSNHCPLKNDMKVEDPLRNDMKAEDFDCNITPPEKTSLGSESTTSSHANSPNNQHPKARLLQRHLLDLNSSMAEELDYSLDTWPSGNEHIKSIENECLVKSSRLNRIFMPLVTRTTLEIAIRPHVASKLVTKTRNKLTQISEISGANVVLVEEEGPEDTKEIVKISGTPEQAEKAQNLLQGFILSTEEDALELL